MESTLKSLGFSLLKDQPHISGERFLMARYKQVLIGRRDSDNLKVIIKASNNLIGKKDIESERKARELLESTVFTSHTLLLPQEIYFGTTGGYMIWIMEFIEQEKVFVKHSLKEQFFLILKAFEIQERFHATTYEHIEKVKKIFPVFYGKDYIEEFGKFHKYFRDKYPNKDIENTFQKAGKILQERKREIDEYCDYLTHTDFVPHNFRIRDDETYMLDCTPEKRTVHFGNKYEGWARFINYMTIHNPVLNKLLFQYIKDNQREEEYLNLRLMRIYKLGFILKFYAESLEKTGGDLRVLTLERIAFWHEILKYVLDDKEVPDEFVEEYKNKRDTLRSEDEKKRQREFAVA